MIDEITLRESEDRGARAEALLKSEEFNNAFNALENEYIQAWKTTHLNDEKGRQSLFLAVNLLGKVRDQLVKMVRDGKLSSKDLANIKYLKR